MGFSNEDRILMKTVYVFKGCEAKEHITEFPNKGWGLRGLNIFLKKAARSWHDDYRRSGNIENMHNLSCILLSNICTQTGYYRKVIGHVVWLQIFSATTLLNIIKISQRLTE